MGQALTISASAILIGVTIAFVYERLKWRRLVNKVQPRPLRYF
jgi:hypothetical protein